ncbi:MAG: nicotinic acid mononucleotide adenylyltransferase, partial [Bacteroidales bacterium]|nr:nicotinic acid mononucleotide adenylyltransferase [Bacteroidales bacterium]
MKQVSLFFGWFNPVHKGHIALAESVLEQKIADEVWFVLSPHNPFKQESGLWSETERAGRLKSALGGRPGLVFCDVELALPQPPYTIKTFRCLWVKYTARRFSVGVGGDNLTKLHLWRECDTILQACDIY